MFSKHTGTYLLANGAADSRRHFGLILWTFFRFCCLINTRLFWLLTLCIFSFGPSWETQTPSAAIKHTLTHTSEPRAFVLPFCPSGVFSLDTSVMLEWPKCFTWTLHTQSQSVTFIFTLMTINHIHIHNHSNNPSQQSATITFTMYVRWSVMLYSASVGEDYVR